MRIRGSAGPWSPLDCTNPFVTGYARAWSADRRSLGLQRPLGGVSSFLDGPALDSQLQRRAPEVETLLERPPGIEYLHTPMYDEPFYPSMVPVAEAAVRMDEQRAAYATGAVIESSVAEAPGDAPVSGQATGADVGTRTAQARFPSMSEKEVYLFSNDPRNLESAHTLRNVGVGNHQPSETEALTREAIVDALIAKVFTKRNAQKAMMEYESLTKTAMPKKLSAEQKMEWHLAAMNEAEGAGGLSFSKFIETFVKPEVTGKAKPRPIANQKEIRLTVLAKVAWAFEWMLFHAFEKMSIKYRTKDHVIHEIAESMTKMERGRWAENDLTAFEFGIGETLKKAEAKILMHIAEVIGIEDVNAELFERVICDRTKACTWIYVCAYVYIHIYIYIYIHIYIHISIILLLLS